MISLKKHPPHVQIDDRIILFDGVCILCNAWSRFIIKHDKTRNFKLCSVQSTEGQQILKHFGFPTDYFETMLYVDGHSYYEKSDAFLQIVSTLGYPWKIASIFGLLPLGLRNWAYDRIALNRYAIFGKYDQCLMPDPDHEGRFLNAGKHPSKS